MRGDRETTFCLDQLDYLTKHNATIERSFLVLNNPQTTQIILLCNLWMALGFYESSRLRLTFILSFTFPLALDLL